MRLEPLKPACNLRSRMTPRGVPKLAGTPGLGPEGRAHEKRQDILAHGSASNLVLLEPSKEG
jgi:hypothetical protein